MADRDAALEFMPHMLEGDKKFLMGAGRLTGKKKFSDEDEMAAYADVLATRSKATGTDVSVPNLGARYKKKIDPNSEIEFHAEKRQKGSPDPWAAGVTYTKRFKQGGKVKSASARADGCCIRGKTRA